MKRVLPGLTVAAAILLAVGVSAQGRNFSGNWTIDAERTSAANAATSGMIQAERRTDAPTPASGGAVAVARSGGGGGGRGGAGGGAVVASPTGEVAAGGMRSGGGGGRGGAAGPTVISIDASAFTIGSGDAKTAYKLDGSATVVQGPNGDRTSKAGWKGDHLVIETTSQGPSGPIVQTTTWYLEGEALVRETSTPTPDGNPIVRKTYFKKAS